MIEPEMAFADMTDAMDNAERFVKHVVTAALDRCDADLKFFDQFYDKTLLARLATLRDAPFARVSYREAIGLLAGVWLLLVVDERPTPNATRHLLTTAPRGDRAARGRDRQGPERVAVPGRRVRHRPRDRGACGGGAPLTRHLVRGRPRDAREAGRCLSVETGRCLSALGGSLSQRARQVAISRPSTAAAAAARVRLRHNPTPLSSTPSVSFGRTPRD